MEATRDAMSTKSLSAVAMTFCSTMSSSILATLYFACPTESTLRSFERDSTASVRHLRVASAAFC
eukprot:974551-Prymnesium_polylepis.1